MSAHRCCIRVIPYHGRDPQSLIIRLYVDNNDEGIPVDVKNAANKMFTSYNIEWEDLQRHRPNKIVTELPSSEKRKKAKQLSDLSRKIEEGLHVFENRLNITAVGASYKVTDFKEEDTLCVTVFVLGKCSIPAGETDIKEIKEKYRDLFGDTKFDVVEGYFKPANWGDPLNASYAFPLRGGVGIGVHGVGGAGTLGGFLEDDEGRCYILSNEHVLNPPKNNTSDADGTNEVVHGAGTSGSLSQDVEEKCSNQHVLHLPELENNTNDVEMENCTNESVRSGAGTMEGILDDEKGESGNHMSKHVLYTTVIGNTTNDVEMDYPTDEIIIEQPARSDYKDMVKNTEDALEKHRSRRSRILGNCTQERNEKFLKAVKAKIEQDIRDTENNLEEIKSGKPRKIGKYVCGLHGNMAVNKSNNNREIFVDAAIAELEEEELKYMEAYKNTENEKERCAVYGFEKDKHFCPNGKIIDLDNFLDEYRKEESHLRFIKIGRTTGFTDYGFIEPSLKELYVNIISVPEDKPAFNPIKFVYCNDCAQSVTGETEKIFESNVCHKCNKELKVEDVEGDVKNDVKNGFSSFWARNCFVIRSSKETRFSGSGDSGALVFGRDNQAWALVFGTHTVPSKNSVFCLASPLSITLKALERVSGKKGLKLWSARY